MSVKSCTRKGCKDVFHAFLVKNAEYDGRIEIPKIKASNDIPERVILFSKAVSCTDYNQWVCFYEDDANLERIWNNPNKYLPILKKLKGVISPDFSLYRDIPLVMQEWNTYRGYVIGGWLQENGVPVIPNVHLSDERLYDFCCLGVEPNSTISTGSHGCVRLLQARVYLKKRLNFAVKQLYPETIIVYGKAPDFIFEKYRNIGITSKQFNSDYSLAHKKEVSE